MVTLKCDFNVLKSLEIQIPLMTAILQIQYHNIRERVARLPTRLKMQLHEEASWFLILHDLLTAITTS